MTLLEVDDAALLDALFADEKVRPMLGRRLAPLLAEVATDQLPSVQEILWQRNYLPALAATPINDDLIESGRFPIREPQWRLYENGLLEPRYAVLDLYLVAELERISEYDEETGWRRLTPKSIAEACDAGLPLEHIIRFLQSYCENGLPTSFLIRLKLWGGGYSGSQTVSIEHAPLLSVPGQILQDLKDDEELGELLGTEVTSENRLVHVTPDKLEKVMELLRKRGFEVE
jgi:hypothetical protein